MHMFQNQEQDRLETYKRILKNSPTVFGAVMKQQEQVRTLSQEECVLAPALNGFVLWMLQEAMKKKIQRLYFLARDGYFMYRCACVYCQKLQLPIECRYLCCSRYSLRIPLFHMDLEDALEYICRGGIDVTIDKILNRAGLTEKEKQEIIEDAGLHYENKEVIPYAKLGEIRTNLADSNLFLDYLCKHSKEALPGLRKYLEQEGMLEETKSALVDSGWVGSMEKTLNFLLKKWGRKEEIPGFYWGLYELPKDVSRTQYYCYSFSPEKGLKEKVYFSNCLFETIFSAPHGMTMRYDTETGRPQFGPCDSNRKVFLEKQEERLMDFTGKMVCEIAKTQKNEKALEQQDSENYKRVVHQILRLFMGNPTKEEAETYGTLEFSDDVLDNSRQQVAVSMNGAELKANHVFHKALVMLGLGHDYIKESAWYEGSAARNGKKVGYHLFMYRLYKYLLYIRKTHYYKKSRREKYMLEAKKQGEQK